MKQLPISKTFFLFLFLGLSTMLTTAQVTITGTVNDPDDQPIPGVNVVVKGTTQGTITDLDGNYTLEVPSTDSVLVFSFVGFQKQEITVGDRTQIDVVLTEDLTELDEVVVIGYGSVKKSDLTGSVSTVSQEDFEDMPVMDISSALSGKSSGVQITSNSGSPGRTPTVRIRGIGTTADADPLYVVDGLPMSPDDVGFLNPADIENISVLKDASATAIYGTRGANGVIMISTKQGEIGEMRLSYNGYYGNQQVYRYPDMMSGSEFARFNNELNELEEGDNNYLDPGNVPSTDWTRNITRSAPIQNHHLSMSGGNETSTFNATFGYFSQEGIMESTNVERYTLRINSRHKIKERLVIGENISYANVQHGGVTLNNRSQIENTDYNSFFLNAMLAPPIYEPYEADGDWVFFPGAPANNPRFSIDRNNGDIIENNFSGSVFAEFEIIENLKFKSIYGMNLGIDESNLFQARTTGTNFGEDPAFADDAANLYKEYATAKSWTWENTLTYDLTAGDHDVTIMAGTSANRNDYYNLEGQDNVGPPNESPSLRYFDYFTGQDAEGMLIYGGANTGRLFGYLGRVTYSFADKYLATGSFRRDASSNFGPNNRWGNFPSMALAWKISNEAFMDNVIFVNHLKLRAGWGQVGNQSIPPNQYVGIISANLDYSFNDVRAPGSTALRPKNDDVKWETTETTNIGVDAGLFDNRLQLAVDVYERTASEMLYNPSLPDIVGVPDVQSPYQNIAEIRNRGYEISLTYKQNAGDFFYAVGGNLSGYKNEVITLGEKGESISYGTFGDNLNDFTRTQAGYPVGAFYGYKTGGIFQDWEDVNTHAFQTPATAPGDLKFKDINRDGQISADDITFIGSPHPDMYYGLHASAKYKSMDLSISGQGQLGNDILVAYKSWTHNGAGGGGRNLHSDMLDAWSPDNTNTDIPRLDPGNTNQNMRFSDYYLEKGDYFRIQTIQLGFTAPESWSNRLTINGLRIYGTIQNLFVFTDYSGVDPEVGQPTQTNRANIEGKSTSQLVMSTDFGQVPKPRVFLVGLEINF